MEELVPIKEACRLWNKSPQTIIKWCEQGALLCDKKPYGENKIAWYVETPHARYERIKANL